MAPRRAGTAKRFHVATDTREATVMAMAPTTANCACRRKMVYEESLLL